MKSHFVNEDVVGVYARQIPLNESNIIEKRNLCVTFLKEAHARDSSYFHNAASMIRRDVCLKHKFDESAIALEDLIWADEMISLGYRIIYEPNAVIHHFHSEATEMTSIRYGKEYSVMERNNKVDI
jgi:GT2 family glycosyltransferase